MRQALKRLMKRDWFHWPLSVLLFLYMEFARVTTRWQIIHPDLKNRHTCKDAAPVLFALWHNRIAMMPYRWDKSMKGLASGHRDGLLVPRVLQFFGIGAILGSSQKGGSQAMRLILKDLKAGYSISVTPDGPRGPRQRVKPGLVMMARMSGVPILIMSVSYQRSIRFKSWDHFMLPLPFGRAVLRFDEFPPLPRSATLEAQETYRRDLENAMNDSAKNVDEMMGQTAVQPADPATPVKGFDVDDLYIIPPSEGG